MTDRKIITREQFDYLTKSISEYVDYIERFWMDLPDAPKHTDEEIKQLEHIKYCYDNIYNDWKESRNAYERKVEKLEARIKELEAKGCDRCEWGRSLGFLPSREHLKDLTISFDDEEAKQ